MQWLSEFKFDLLRYTVILLLIAKEYLIYNYLTESD